jgi:hypothetical protein
MTKNTNNDLQNVSYINPTNNRGCTQVFRKEIIYLFKVDYCFMSMMALYTI